ncbi:tripartite tricarboxylate transporter substrate binding protein [Bradyrhizobium neotropicale]|uniref:Bug family tripartite tricarboxylate transporter substrate binding protein n=1 Tax=Bradyrhizobium neotropicale TaxID=1497615 RepID=UPI001AD73AC9|nr:tripartite tricarboxylate transporter substrate binding protein [Bradyrhizobium neotropicale]MBO4227630.1 tripartite tricarboxylate transporter substrate binding protein [Bradyrhizobium neotropicale]
MRQNTHNLSLTISTLLAATLALLLISSAGIAGDYPDRTVRIIVPFSAGGTADAIPRLVADWLSRKWGQPIVIENRIGSAGNVGAEEVYNADPDGYTLLSAPPPPLVINQNLFRKLRFDPARFEPIVVMAQVPNAIFVRPNGIKASSVAELIDHLRANPDGLTAATLGSGTTSHLSSQLFETMAKVKLRQIPYRSTVPALQGLLAGDVDLMFDNLGVTLPLVTAGKLKLLAVASPKRLPSMPNVPTIAETLPGFEAVAWFAMVAPPGTPKAIVEKINADVNEVLARPDIQANFRKLSAEIYGGSVERTSQYLRSEVDRWSTVIKSAKIEMQ